MGRVTTRRTVQRRGASATADAGPVRSQDTLVVEEPLEIRVDGEPLSVTMRTPGNDFDLVAGFLVSEDVVRSASDISTMRYCAGVYDGANTYNVIDVARTDPVRPVPLSAQRHVLTTSSCGLCGKASIDSLRTTTPYALADDDVRIDTAVLATLPNRLRTGQRVFERTGGLHAAGLFTAAGELVCLREDVGRHNAVDKVVGWALREGRLPLGGHILQVSGRASYELTQKAAMAGIPVLAAVSAPSSLAVDLAAELGMTLAGFVRDGAMNVYAGAERLR